MLNLFWLPQSLLMEAPVMTVSVPVYNRFSGGGEAELERKENTVRITDRVV